jgi:uncharacterized protein (TIGR03086 family)
MSEISQRYGRLAAAFGDKIAAVSPAAWSNPSPCEGWTARDVVRHVVTTQGMFLGFVGRELGELPSVDTDPGAAWAAASSVVLADLQDPSRAAAEFDGFTGKSTFEAAVDRFLCFDLVVHGWDLAQAAGLEDRIHPDEVSRVRAAAEQFGDALRSPQAFGPEVEAPHGADEQAQLLAFLGRVPSE